MVSLEVDGDGATIGHVEVGIALSNELDYFGHKIEVTSPDGTTVVVFDEELRRPFDFDVTFSNSGKPYDEVLLPLGWPVQVGDHLHHQERYSSSYLDGQRRGELDGAWR